MSLTCNKCKQAPPHLSDSWCLACTAVEALGAELQSHWGSVGARAVCHDVLASAVRHIRSLRRLSVAGAGTGRAPIPDAAPEVAGSGRAASAAPSRRAPTPPPAPKNDIKKEESGTEESGSEYSESEEETKEDEKTAKTPAEVEEHPTTAPKAKPEERKKGFSESSTRPKSPAGSSRVRERTPRKEDKRWRERSEIKRREERGYRSSRCELRERGNRTHRSPERGHRREKRDKKVRRAGTKHKRLGRAQNNPFQRFHHRPPEGYFDQPATF